jgi:hypothetical protein
MYADNKNRSPETETALTFLQLNAHETWISEATAFYLIVASPFQVKIHQIISSLLGAKIKVYCSNFISHIQFSTSPTSALVLKSK